MWLGSSLRIPGASDGVEFPDQPHLGSLRPSWLACVPLFSVSFLNGSTPLLPAFQLSPLSSGNPSHSAPPDAHIHQEGDGVRTALASHNTRVLHNSLGRGRGRDPPEEATGPLSHDEGKWEPEATAARPDLGPASGQGEAAHVASCS